MTSPFGGAGPGHKGAAESRWPVWMTCVKVTSTCTAVTPVMGWATGATIQVMNQEMNASCCQDSWKRVCWFLQMRRKMQQIKWQLFPPVRGISLQPFINTPTARQGCHFKSTCVCTHGHVPVWAHACVCVGLCVHFYTEDQNTNSTSKVRTLFWKWGEKKAGKRGKMFPHPLQAQADSSPAEQIKEKRSNQSKHTSKHVIRKVIRKEDSLLSPCWQ